MSTLNLNRLDNPFYVIPFEAAFAIYAIMNAFFTLNVESVVLQNLYSLVGLWAFIAPVLQMVGGTVIIMGIAKRMANIEAAGLCLVTSLFAIRSIALCLDGEVTLNDLNSLAISSLLILAGITRLNHILIVSKILREKLL